jgi:hypothetical protein
LSSVGAVVAPPDALYSIVPNARIPPAVAARGAADPSATTLTVNSIVPEVPDSSDA